MDSDLISKYEALWSSASGVPDVFHFLSQHSQSSEDEVVEVLLFDQKKRWNTDSPLEVEDYLNNLSGLAKKSDRKLELAIGEFKARQGREPAPSIDEFSSRFDDLGDHLRSALTELTSAQPVEGDAEATVIFTSIDQSIDRYRLIRVLGEGAFGRVYLGHDNELLRQVAIKIPTSKRFHSSQEGDLFLEEARKLASLDHPNIVPVYDTGRTSSGLVYVVSKYIHGCTLRDVILNDRPAPEQSAELVATIARALHHAHEKKIVHRDVKPGNVLIDGRDGTPYVADFGLAIRADEGRRKGWSAGTPRYMSPEQFGATGDPLDGRSDIFSLGVVFYQLLTGWLPFPGPTTDELRRQIVSGSPRPPRQHDRAIPAELARICLKALAKHVSDRYDSAADFADDLMRWKEDVSGGSVEKRVVPKGLRSFDEDDAGFFLKLLPGPYDESGYPECVRAWKHRLDSQSHHSGIEVGMICGPSGCGKSSFVKAGLLPLLGRQIQSLYVDCAGGPPETQLRKSLRGRFPQIPEKHTVIQILDEIAAGMWLGDGEKLLIVLDQFEQWIHSEYSQSNALMLDTLRSCNGRTIQSLLLVRDDYWIAANRMLEKIEIVFVLGQNLSYVDLFDPPHARNVLFEFGRAYGCLPDKREELSADQEKFLTRAIEGLTREGKVICVRLSLFADMIRGMPWETSTLHRMGGTEGVGVAFLDSIFNSSSAPAVYRRHRKAARAVLQALLPDAGVDIRGQMQNARYLKSVSGYANDDRRFEELIQILDGEVRLITAADSERDLYGGANAGDTCLYQLTHDYLVGTLRRWLNSQRSWVARLGDWCRHPDRVAQAGNFTTFAASVFLIIHLSVSILSLTSDTASGFGQPDIVRAMAIWIAIFDIPYLGLGLGIAARHQLAIVLALLLDAVCIGSAMYFLAFPLQYSETFGLEIRDDAVRPRYLIITLFTVLITMTHVIALVALRRYPRTATR